MRRYGLFLSMLVVAGALVATAAAAGTETHIFINDDSYTGNTLGSVNDTPALVIWHNIGSQPHTVTQNTRGGDLGLFDSGPIAPGGQFSYEFNFIGTYRYHDTLHPGFQAWLSISPTVAPVRAPPGTPRTVTLSKIAPPEGYVFDVRQRLKGTKNWELIVDGTTEPQVTIVEDTPGTHLLEARLRRTADDRACRWSPRIGFLVT